MKYNQDGTYKWTMEIEPVILVLHLKKIPEDG
jgi:hypothetical protein